ncbi:hypothetical protein, partial [uncultured Veillonella sp.]|uniref:hypothetical protein n=1 Tax=uncultured Veillonella sp. TaxID=159268 RepID=UPI002634C92E
VVEKLACGRIPVDVIDMRLYGIMDGKSILTSTLEKIKSEMQKRCPDYVQFAIVDTDFSN